MPRQLARGSAELLLVFLCVALGAYFFRTAVEPNGDGRLALVYALVDRGTLAVDAYVAERPLIALDLAMRDSHYYVAKPPLPSLLLVPVYAALRLVFPPAHMWDWQWRWVLTLSLSTASFAALALLLWRLLHDLAYPRRRALAAVLATALGTPLLVYANYLFSHELAALLLVASLWLTSRAPRYPFAAGLAFGALLATEFIAAIPASVLFAYHSLRAARDAGLRGLAACVGGSLLGVSPLLAYQAAAFGSPLANVYAYLADPAFRMAYAGGLFGLPRPDVALALLVSPSRGLFVFAPPALAGALGALLVWRRSPPARVPLALSLSASALLVVTLSGYAFWEGGSSYGPRHLLAIVPLLCWPLAALGTSWLLRLGVVAGLLQSVALSASIPLLNPAHRFPPLDLYLTERSDSLVGLGLTALGIPGALELAASLPTIAVVTTFVALALRDATTRGGARKRLG